MHLLKFSVSLIAVMGILPAANAATARPGVLRGNAATRMPTMTAYINNLGGPTTVASTTSGGASLLSDKECIDAYTQCAKGADVCGPNFEECTNRVLFHGKMPNCLSALSQCSAVGINSLFGTNSTTALSTVSTKNSYGEVTDYTYPTDGSVLGQMITAAAIQNKYDTSTCVRRYTSCLRKDTVCGQDFELCTTDSEFRKQRVFCDSTLARCQSDGLKELFGTATTTATPSATSRIGELISEGAALAAVNAVSTCYKVVDQCILGACNANPYKCIADGSAGLAQIVDEINNGASTAAEVSTDTISNSAVASYIRNSCQDTIGSNKYCYATFLGNGQMPTASQLSDEDNQAEVYDLAYSARMNSGMRAKLSDIMDKFDTKAKQKCTDAISKCVMRTCGGGLGSVCYSLVYSGADKSINKDGIREEIKTGCASVVNTDAYCKYAAANPSSVGTYSYSYINADAFDTLFPEYSTGNDPIGVVASLNASLSSNYSDAAIAKMKKSCQNIATSCVKSMCGNDYVNCYRNRTDIYSNLTNTGDTGFDKSMNKVGGVLDYTIVLGLCLDTVKNASTCEEHLAIEAAKINLGSKSSTESSWGGSETVRGGWIDAGSATSVTTDTETVNAVDENGNQLCSAKNGDQGPCDTVDANGNVYDTPVKISYTTYVQSQAASSLFKDLIYDIEKEAQAKYNAKLTKQQNMCLAGNENGGIMGNRDNGSVYMWVKLKSNKVPKSYSTSGLQDNQFTASNDLYGSFCRIRVTIQSDDKNIQDKIRNGAKWASAYFAAGDAFTCGSWIPQKDLEIIADNVAEKATEQTKKNYDRWRGWLTVAGTLGGGVGGYYLTDAMQDGKFLGGLLNNTKQKKASSDYKDVAKNCMNKLNDANDETNVRIGLSYARQMENIDGADTYKLGDLISSVETALNTRSKTDEKIDETTEQITAAVANPKYNTAKSARDSAWSAYAQAVDAYSQIVTSDKNDCLAPINAAIVAGYDTSLVDNALASTFKKNPHSRAGSAKKGDACESASAYAPYAAAVRTRMQTYTAAEKTLSETASEIGGGEKQTVKTGKQIVNPAYTVANNEYNSSVMSLRAACQMISESGLNDEAVAKAEKKRTITNLVGTGVTALAGGLIVNRLTNDIQESLLDAKQKEAYDAWMNEVGSHIQCYIGGDEVGTYGDVIGTALE